MRIKLIGIGVLSLLAAACEQQTPLIDQQKADLGSLLFFDTMLSEPQGNQSCASCHTPSAGFAAPQGIMTGGVAHGATPTLFGNRNPPTLAYSQFSPTPQHYDAAAGTIVGGQFLDGRAADLAAQALKPLLNPVEMGNTNSAMVLAKLQARPYVNQFTNVFGNDVFSDSTNAYAMIGQAIAEFEKQTSISKFSSKFDAYRHGRATLSAQEQYGLSLFNGKGNCASCHPSAGEFPLFTDFTNDNLGVPKNPANPFYTQSAAVNPDGVNYIDLGIGAIVDDIEYNGKFKVPTLRNIALTAPYMHNGVFTTLTQVVQFYNTACAPGNPDGWAAAEYPATRNCRELGNLRLTTDEIAAIVAFLQTLTDE
ncbi:MAG: c-type cytochrome [Spirochaetes bacterium]|nr:c-type cytochrome [Spirochaetota bacterium]